VFLLSRIKEEYNRTGDSHLSVANGLATTARVISAAAAIMVFVFGSFILENDRTFKLFGVGLALLLTLFLKETGPAVRLPAAVTARGSHGSNAWNGKVRNAAR